MPLLTRPAEADPELVDYIVQSIGSALEHAALPINTTPADILSALFTVLDRMLRVATLNQAPQDREFNAAEVARVLTSLLAEFGSSTLH